MTTNHRASTTHPSTTSHTKGTATMSNTTTSPPSATADPIFVTTPPPITTVPTPPAGFVAPQGAPYRGFLPKKEERVAMPAAVQELQGFRDFTGTFGKTAPAQANVIQMFDAADKWSQIRAASAAWDAYCVTQEGIAWSGVRAQMARMNPAFALASQTDQELRAQYPNLATLLSVKKGIAQRGVSARRANAAARAKGQPATHGTTAKRKNRSAAIAAQKKVIDSAPSPTVPATPTTPLVSTAPVPPVASSTPATVPPVTPRT